jgi:hypothetical protein
VLHSPPAWPDLRPLGYSVLAVAPLLLLAHPPLLAAGASPLAGAVPAVGLAIAAKQGADNLYNVSGGHYYEGDMGAAIADWYNAPAGMPHRPVSQAISGPGGWATMGASIASPPVTVTANVNATLAGKAEAVFGGVTVELGGLGAAIDGRIKAAIGTIGGMFKSGSGNSSAGFDGRSAPSTPDGSVMHGGH